MAACACRSVSPAAAGRFFVVLAALAASPGSGLTQSCGPGQFFSPPIGLVPGASPVVVVAADFNEDGRPDLVAGNSIGQSVSVFLGAGDGTFASPVHYAAGGSADDVAVSDLDGDGILDLAIASINGSRITLLRGNGAGGAGDGTFTAHSQLATGQDPRAVLATDLNADGAPELVVAASDGISVYTARLIGGRPSGTFDPPTRYAVASPWDVAAADLNSDGALDLAVPNGLTASVSILFGQTDVGAPDGSFAFGGQVLVAAGARNVAVDDFSGDGIPDLAVANGGFVHILTNVGAGGLGTGTFVVTSQLVGGSVYRVTTADVNRDGLADLVAGTSSSVGVLIAEGAAGVPTGVFNPPEFYAAGGAPIGVVAVDLNGDGGSDVAVADVAASRVNVMLGRCTGPVPLGPAIVDVTPRVGRVGDVVVVSGRNFGPSPLVSFNGVPCAEQSSLPGGVQVTVPAGASSGPVSVTTEYGTAVAPWPFLIGDPPVIESFTPAAARVGRPVQIDGRWFTGTHQVSFGNAASRATFVVESDTRLHAIVDAAATDGPIVVRTPLGFGTSATAFTRLGPDSAASDLSVADVPADEGGAVVVRWRRSDVDVAPHTEITGYRVWRRAPLETAVRAPRAAPAGVSYAGFWEPIATVPAAYLDGYALVAATTQDSIDGSNPYTAFFVQAITATPGWFHDSPADSGYSVDNLAPAVPQGFVVETRDDGRVRLRWRAAPEPDWAAFHLHRGEQPGFAPDDANRLAIVAGIEYEDATAPAQAHYKLRVLDRHGNASPFAVASAPGSDGPAAAGLALEGVSPNPVRGGPVRIRFALPAEGIAVLEWFDVRGRRVARHAWNAAAGRGDVSWTPPAPLAPGVYLVRLEQGGQAVSGRAVVLP